MMPYAYADGHTGRKLSLFLALRQFARMNAVYLQHRNIFQLLQLLFSLSSNTVLVLCVRNVIQCFYLPVLRPWHVKYEPFLEGSRHAFAFALRPSMSNTTCTLYTPSCLIWSRGVTGLRNHWWTHLSSYNNQIGDQTIIIPWTMIHTFVWTIN